MSEDVVCRFCRRPLPESGSIAAKGTCLRMWSFRAEEADTCYHLGYARLESELREAREEVRLRDATHVMCNRVLRDEMPKLKAGAEKDYAEMRRFQSLYINTDHARIAAESALSAERTARVEAERERDEARMLRVEERDAWARNVEGEQGATEAAQAEATSAQCAANEALAEVRRLREVLDGLMRAAGTPAWALACADARAALAAEPGDAGASGVCDCCGRGPDVCPMAAGASATCAGGGDCACFLPPEGHPGAAEVKNEG